jgi:cell division protein FtsZ
MDDGLGDELRVTVIATGIGGSAKTKPVVDSPVELPLRGKVRDITPADLQNAVEYDEPTFIRQKRVSGESGGSAYRGFKGIIMDNNDLDVPTFLRRKAD